jgi:dihydrofolate reductase
MELIIAVSQNNIIGNNNKLLWNIPEDLKRFYNLTKNNIIVMGRKTFESIGKPLKNRINIVITNNTSYLSSENLFFTTFENFNNLIKNINDNKKIFIIGGEQIYYLFLSKCSIINITKIYKDFNGDCQFNLNLENYKLVEESELNYSENETCNYQYLIYNLINKY